MFVFVCCLFNDILKFRVFGMDNRESKVLSFIIDQHIESGDPIGSRLVANRLSNLSLSAASMRNIMSSLTERGYIDQPHTSAGRIPTDKGYRYYVNHRLEAMGSIPTEVYPESIANPSYGFDDILKNTIDSLAKSTNLIALILSPRASFAKLRYLQFVRLGNQKILYLFLCVYL